jgi:hypothetical protein
MKQPTTIKRLNELIAQAELDCNDTAPTEVVRASSETLNWLTWAHDMLVTRKLYHKRRQLVMRRKIQLLEEHLSPDELEQIEQDAAKRVEDDIINSAPEVDEDEEVPNEQ